MKGFSRKIGTSSCLLLEVITHLSNSKATNRLTQPIVDYCRNTLQAFQVVHLQDYFKETNRAADFLAKLGHSQLDPFVYYVSPPFGIMEVLTNDANGVLYTQTTRDVTVSF